MLEDLQRFLESAPTSWHAAQEIGNRLAAIDFTPLEEDEKWELEGGAKYFVQRGGSVCAFAVPLQKPSKFVLIASHTDSPALKLKPNPEVQEGNMTLLETELYGSPILATWLSRDLAIAGRIVVQNSQGEIEEKLVFLDEAPFIIPQLPIHLDRDVNDKGLLLNKQDNLRPIVSLGETADYLSSLLKKQAFYQSMLAFDLMAVPIEKSRFLGADGEMLASYRLDNLSSAHACTVAIASAPVTDALQMALFWDHEEIGSRSAEGAGSPFLADTLKRIGFTLGMDEEELIRKKSHSLCVSVDVAHAYNPNYPKKFDTHHRLLPGKGIALKYNADKKYASDAKTAAIVAAACKKLNLPSQPFTSRSDMPSGSTVGPIVAEKLGFPTVDIGIPLLSMHSAREVIACQDHLDMCQLLTHLLQL